MPVHYCGVFVVQQAASTKLRKLACCLHMHCIPVVYAHSQMAIMWCEAYFLQPLVVLSKAVTGLKSHITDTSFMKHGDVLHINPRLVKLMCH